MSHALIKNGAVASYPYTIGQLRRDNPDTSFPANMSSARLAEWGVVEVVPSAQPAVPLTKNLVEGTPVFTGGAWTQVWAQVDATPEQIAQRTETQAQESEFDAAKLDAWVVQFMAMTPTEAQTFINNNGATVAALRTQVARLAYTVRVLIRREFNK